MTPRKSQRKRKAVTIWEEKEAPPAAKDPKIPKKADRTKQTSALKPITTGPVPEAVRIDPSCPPELPNYDPPLKLRSKCSESQATDLSELHTFQQLFTQEVIDIIIRATNSYTANAREETDISEYTRQWKPVNSTDIWRYIGYLLYMGEHSEKEHTVY
jgi:Transposase IS4